MLGGNIFLVNYPPNRYPLFVLFNISYLCIFFSISYDLFFSKYLTCVISKYLTPVDELFQ